MAVNKNFVVKNGIEVATDVIVASSETKNVGVGTTVGQVLLDVRGAIGATHLSVSGVGTIVTLNSTNLTGTAGTITTLTSTDATITNGTITGLTGTAGTITTLTSTDATITNGTVTSLTGTAATITTLTSTNATVTNLTPVNVNASGVITATSYYGDGSNLSNVGGYWIQNDAGIHTTGSVGVGTTNPNSVVPSDNTSILNVGILTAYKLYGDGSGLTGLAGSPSLQTVLDEGNTSTTGMSITGVSTFTTAEVTNGTITNLTGTAGTITNLTSTNVNVSGVSTLTGNVSFGSSAFFGDSYVANFGDSNDLQIYHDGSHSYIKNTKAGSFIFINSAGGMQLRVNSSEAALAATANGSTSLFYNNSEKFKTLSIGATVTGDLYATAFYGDGSNLTNIVSGVGINTAGGNVGYGATLLDFRGSGISTVTFDSATGIGTINIQGGDSTQIIKDTFTVSGSQSVFDLSQTYTTGTLDVYLNGVKLNSSDYTETDSDTITLGSAAVDGDILEVLNFKATGSLIAPVPIVETESFAVGVGTLITLNLSSAQDHKVTATGITTITCSGGTEGESHTVRIVNSGISTIGFSTYFLWPSGSSPTLPTADSSISLISFTVHSVGAGGTQLLAGASVNFS